MQRLPFSDTLPTQPAGLDQQGRWRTRQPMAAEACTDFEGGRMHSTAAARFWSHYLLAVLIAAIAGAVAWLG